MDIIEEFPFFFFFDWVGDPPLAMPDEAGLGKVSGYDIFNLAILFFHK
jgi:hypothetical protein